MKAKGKGKSADGLLGARGLGVDYPPMAGDSVTLSLEGERSAQAAARAAPYLVVLLECHRPAARSSRHLLGETSEVAIGRGGRDNREFERESGRSGDRLSIAVPDKWMSSRHARLVKRFGRWYLEDAESKNGTIHNGVAVDQVRLGDGDIFEAGRTLFLFRNAAPVPNNCPLDRVIDDSDDDPALTTLSPAYGAALEQLRSVASARLSLTITGETGSGKEVVAHALHRLSGRNGPFVALNCGAISASLVESELFGYVRGAFSGADDDREGMVRAADGGTLFLDEIAEMPASTQAALLRVLQEREVVPVGATRAIPVDVRVLAATHQDLRRLIATGGFRRDLFARLAGFEFALPPLRDRREDLGLLFTTLLGLRSDLSQHPGISVEAARLLFAYDWPLNVRELDNTIAAAIAFAGDALLEVSHLSAAVRAGPMTAHAVEFRAGPLTDKDQALRDDLVSRLRENGGNVSATARDLGKDRKQIQRWLKRFAIDATQFRSE